MFKSFPIARKLPLALLGCALMVGAGVGIGSFLVGSTQLRAQAEQNLSTLAFERANQLSVYLQSVGDDVIATSRLESTVQALRDFGGAWLQLGATPAETARQAYVTANPNADDRSELVTLGTTGAYDVTHTRFHPGFRAQTLSRGYRDLYLFDLKGMLVYSVGKADDFGTSFAADGPLGTTGLGAMFQQAVLIENGDDMVFADFAPYAPAGGAAASFFAKPVFNATGRKIGVLAIQLPADRISRVIDSRTGLGETGEIIVVGQDGLFRTDSRFSEGSDVLASRLSNSAVDAALAGSEGMATSSDYRGAPMMLASAPVSILGTNWAAVAVKSSAEIFAPVGQMRDMMLIVGGILMLAVAGIGLLFSRSITRPISRLTGTMEAIAAGAHDSEVGGRNRRDEFGAMARAVEVFRENGLKVMHLTEEERAASEQRRIERADMMQALQRGFGKVVDAAIAGDFSHRVAAEFADAELNVLAKSINSLVETVERGLGETGKVLAALADADLTQRMTGDYDGAFARLKADTNAVADKLSAVVTQLRETSGSLKTATGEILSGANNLSERTTKQAATIEQTSATIEQLAATVLQNARKAESASAQAQGVSRTAEEGGAVMTSATEAMERIQTSSGKISNIIGLIDDIAFQTNLLALNASVEAARAGDAGKGFAVVAVEVRRLAQSAASASSEVKALIEQSASEVRGGSKLVADAAGKLSTMLAAIRENSAALDGIARESRAQATSIDELTGAVRQLDEMTQHNAALVEETNAAIEQTEAQAIELDRIVEVFTINEISHPKAAPAKETRPGPAMGIKGLQQRVTQAARSYLSRGTAAVDADWSEF